MTFEFKQYRQALIQLIGVGPDNASSIRHLIASLSLPYDSDPESFRRGLNRELERMARMADGELIVEGGGRGRPKQFYWRTQSVKSEMYESHKPQWHSFPHAMAMAFIGEHFAELLPTHLMDELEDDINLAWSVLASSNEYRERSREMRMKIDFQPSGYQLLPKNNQSSDDKRKIYQALNSEQCFSACYDSIHPNIPKTITVSPQRVCYINHQVLVLSYIHEARLTKYLELNRLKQIDLLPQQSFQSLDLNTLKSRHRFQARAHTWVKNYFDSVQLGDSGKVNIEQENDDCWIISAEIDLPNHFNDPEKPDPFFFANFLGMFADSIEVLQPQCLRDEMARRAQQYFSLYLDPDTDGTKVITSSPHDMANQ